MRNKLVNLKAVICDLDGTLVHSVLDFRRMREAIGVPETLGILEYIDQIGDPLARASAHAKLHEFEKAGAAEASWIPGVPRFLECLKTLDLPLGIVTRNSRATAQATLDRFGIEVDLLVAREDARPKPSPDGLLRCLKRWSVRPDQTIFIGDYLYDIQAGNAAEVPTVLYAPEELPEYSGLATYVVRDFAEIAAWLPGA